MKTSYDPLYLFIGGEWISAEGRNTAAVVNPATGREIGRVPLATAGDLDHALEVTRLSFEQWRQTVPDQRAKILKRAADLILERAPQIAAQMTLEEGKPLNESLDEVTRAAEYFEWFAESARRIDGRVVPANRPEGVLQVVFGVPDQVSSHLIASPIIRKVTFTGSVPIGRLLSARAAEGVKPITLELGGHGPVLVFEDADIEKAAVEGVANRFRGTGQVCISSTRFLIQRGAYQAFVDHFVAATQALRIGDGLHPDTQVGPLANPRQLAKMEELVADAVEKGARVLVGGEALSGEGYFFQPTVLADVPMNARVMHEEPFGPIAVLMPFDELADGLQEANRLPYGLSAYAFTSSARTAIDVADGLEAGMIGINQYRIVATELPFGGMKESGHGSEGGIEGIEHYLTHKFISQV
ncbi:NAD-dependent succinate-semialdehyde dehydrogenase [Pseudomonas sp. NPDC087690]|uniref:NAD-dependent succinate-semialdehyde dehydrogenase n=1 Tax=Pseudomonas sp. NPDC087690 TaxID=3364446 RepID=UPI003819ED8C